MNPAKNKLLSIVIPVFNEEKTVASVIARALRADTGDYQKEIIVVDDGSTDGTRKIISELGIPLRYLSHERNLGKGRAVRTGIGHSSGDLVIIQDADLEYPPSNMSRLLDTLEGDRGAAAVYGSRNLKPRKRGYKPYILGVFVLTSGVNLRFGTQLTDVYTCHKLFRRESLQNLDLKSDGFEIEMELTAKLLKNGSVIREIPIDYEPRTFAEGKKIRWWDGLRGALTLIRNL